MHKGATVGWNAAKPSCGDSSHRNLKLLVDTCRMHLFRICLWAGKYYICMIYRPFFFPCQPTMWSSRLSGFGSFERWHGASGEACRRGAYGVGADLLAVLCSAARCQMSAVSPRGNMCMWISECVCSYLLSSLPDRDRLQGWGSGAALQVLKGKVPLCACRSY